MQNMFKLMKQSLYLRHKHNHTSLLSFNQNGVLPASVNIRKHYLSFI